LLNPVVVPKLPTTRQTPPRLASAKKRAADRRSLAHAFLTFTQAAGSLEKSYGQLQAEVARLRAELEVANTELSRSLEETSRVRVFLSRVLEGLPCGVLVTDQEHRPRLLNPEARRLLDLEEHWRPDAAETLPPVIEKLLSEAAAGAAQQEFEWTSEEFREQRLLAVSASRGEAGSASETIWILRDISDQKRAAEEREAARRAHALAEVAAVLAHEIRNPLGSMELFAGLLSAFTANAPEAHQWVTHLQAGLRSLSGTVNNVLQFHGQPSAELLPTRVDRLLRDTAEFLGPLARQRGLSIELRNPLGQFIVGADAQRLQQVFFNLALNAFHAMPPAGALTIEVRPAEENADRSVRIDFVDQGRGMEAQALAKIFEPGFTTKPGSPGLGLSVCRKLIEQHGGTIEATSLVGRGSTFSLCLPRWKGCS
jgi:two-component system sensor histidine kinase FlrB